MPVAITMVESVTGSEMALAASGRCPEDRATTHPESEILRQLSQHSCSICCKVTKRIALSIKSRHLCLALMHELSII